MRRFSALIRSSAFLLFATLAAQMTSAAQHIKCASDVNHAPAGNIAVIVQYKSDPADSEVQRVFGLGGNVGKRFHSIRSMQAVVNTQSLDSLVANPNVAYVSLDRNLGSLSGGDSLIAPSNGATSIATSAEFTNEPINSPSVWKLGYVGTNIGVAVIDSGINNVSDLSTQSYSYYGYSSGYAGYTTGASSYSNSSAASSWGGSYAGDYGNIATSSSSYGSGYWQYGSGTRVVYSQSFVPNELTTTTDPFGHGTHVAGLIGGNGRTSSGSQFFRTFIGVAPNVNLINLRVLDENGMSTDSTVIAAIEQAIALKNTYNIKVINLSLGRPIFESYTLDPLDQAVEQAWKAGIVVVVAAGNNGRDLALNAEGYGTVNSPANDPYVLTVGAANTSNTAVLSDDVMASYSSKGPTFIDQVSKPDIIAPGNLVTSLLNTTSNILTENPTFFTPMSFYKTGGRTTVESTNYMPLSGTSMSTGVTSGAVALLLQAVPNLTPDQAKAVLMRDANKAVIPATNVVTDATTGITYTAHDDVFTQGAGYLDIYAAVNDALDNTIPAGTAMSPIATYVFSNNSVVLVPDSSSLWGTTAYWGSSSVYGSSAFVGGSTAYWGSATVASASNPSSMTAYWGSSVLSGSALLAGSADVSAYSNLWSTSTVLGSTAYWGSATPAASSILWSNTAYWGSSTTTPNTAYWGSSSTSSQTAYWGSSSPMIQ